MLIAGKQKEVRHNNLLCLTYRLSKKSISPSKKLADAGFLWYNEQGDKNAGTNRGRKK